MDHDSKSLIFESWSKERIWYEEGKIQGLSTSSEKRIKKQLY